MFKISDDSTVYKKTWKRKILQLLLIVFLLIGIAYMLLWSFAGKIVFNMQSPAQQAQILDNKNPEQFIKHFKLNNMDFYVPAVYFAYFLPEGDVLDNVMFKVHYSDFEWVKKKPYQDTYYDEENILISLSKSGRPLNEYLQITTDKYIKNHFELNMWSSKKPNAFGHIYIYMGTKTALKL